jgi:hypothetical protein
MSRRPLTAKVERVENDWTLIKFSKGGYYWLHDGKLFTGVHKRPASEKINAKFLKIANYAVDNS